MKEGHACPECGDELRYLPDKKNWYCTNCQQSSFPKNLQRTNPLPLKNHSTKAVWLLVIVVLSVVILTFVAAAALYMMMGGMIDNDSTPSGELYFSESSTESGLHTGGFTTLSETVYLEDVSLIITDNSIGESASLQPLVDGGTLVISGGLRCSFSDVNQNSELETEDILRIENGGSGDIMKFVYIPTGGLIAQYTFI